MKDRWELSRTFEGSPECTQHSQASPCSATQRRQCSVMLQEEVEHLKASWPSWWPIRSKLCPYSALNSPLPAAAGTGTDLEAVQEPQLTAGCSSILLWRGTRSPNQDHTEAVEHHVTHTSGSLSTRTSIQLATLRAPGKP